MMMLLTDPVLIIAVVCIILTLATMFSIEGEPSVHKVIVPAFFFFVGVIAGYTYVINYL